MWKELEDWSHVVTGLWCLAGDFNQVMFAREKQGRAPFNHDVSASFAACLNACNLVDKGFKGQLFTWQRGSLKERLNRVVCTLDWQERFPDSSVTHLLLQSSDHCGLWIRMSNGNNAPARDYFKFLGPWLEHPNFEQQVQVSWVYSDSWQANVHRLTTNLNH